MRWPGCEWMKDGQGAVNIKKTTAREIRRSSVLFLFFSGRPDLQVRTKQLSISQAQKIIKATKNIHVNFLFFISFFIILYHLT